ncbi:FmdB family zinc ribbon protein [Litorihabitans aurantiacus]|uniref:Putative regulatory protein FmdB zinc ribbon domain-containing protein n=1 Tax=Litorihabitans aurantiacus TaxID=1930061 RepID=A0AA37XCP6_9MICO|nr:FmdB family zinc ribbon protein [Litorihabitans aurantiacus]GMA30451.1 hypothetical protein GCM10025875_04430 [Litorihabitans aurantiacus]
MPTYAYRCTECGHAFDIYQSFTDDALTVCPECSGKLRKVLSPVGVVFKGSGFYRNDSRGTTASRESASSSSSGESGSGSKAKDGGSSSSKESSSSTGSGSSSSGGSSSSSGTGSSSSGGSSS